MSIEQRLHRLERENRIHRGLWGLAALIVIAVVVWGQAQGIPEVIKARKFQVINEAGKQVVEIDSWQYGGRIVTYSSAKYNFWPSVIVTHTDQGNGLLLIYNQDGNPVISAGSDASRDGLISISGKDGNLRVKSLSSLGLVHYTKTGNVGSILNDDGLTIYIDNKTAAIFGDGLAILDTNQHFISILNDEGLTIYNKSAKTTSQLFNDIFGHGMLRVCNRNGDKCKTFQYAPD